MLERQEIIEVTDNDLYLTYRKQLAKAIVMAIVGGLIWIAFGLVGSTIFRFVQLISGVLIGGVSYLGGGAIVAFFVTIYIRRSLTVVTFDQAAHVTRKDLWSGVALILAEITIALIFCASCLSVFGNLVGPLLSFGLPLVGITTGVYVFVVDFLRHINEE